MDILELVKQHAPIIGDQIAEMLGISRATIRSDLSLLVMLGYLDSKPKVGYFIGKNGDAMQNIPQKLLQLKVKDVQSAPINVRETTSVHDAIITLFMDNVGSLTVINEDGFLIGVLSRKDLLKVSLGHTDTSQIPVSLVMTRQPNIITITPDDTILEAGRRLIHHAVDTLPVVTGNSGRDPFKLEVVGRITKTTMTKVLIDLAFTGNE